MSRTLATGATPTTKVIAKAIEKLRIELKYEYGVDFSFTVMGAGELIGASDFKHGEAIARVAKGEVAQ